MRGRGVGPGVGQRIEERADLGDLVEKVQQVRRLFVYRAIDRNLIGESHAQNAPPPLRRLHDFDAFRHCACWDPKVISVSIQVMSGLSRVG
jgi:hypothetical protein